MNRALIVIDAQNDFCHQEGVLTTKEAQAAVPRIKKLIDEFYSNGEAIYYTMDTHYDNYYLNTQEGKNLPIKHCIYNTWGWRIINECSIYSTKEDNVHCFMKESFAYSNWEDELLDQYDEIIVCGFVSSICCISNVLNIKMLYPELPIKFVASASAGLNPANHACACEVMRSCQVEVIE
jgi:nicotinamidase-related amidase